MPTQAEIEAAKSALAPFAEVYDMYRRNGYLAGLDLIVRQDGRVLGHAGFGETELQQAHDAFIALGGKVIP